MHVPEPSRRQLLRGLLATVFAWLWPGKTEAGPLPPAPAASGSRSADVFCSVTTCTYDGTGRSIAVEYGLPYPPKLPASGYDTLSQVTTYTYDALG